MDKENIPSKRRKLEENGSDSQDNGYLGDSDYWPDSDNDTGI